MRADAKPIYPSWLCTFCVCVCSTATLPKRPRPSKAPVPQSRGGCRRLLGMGACQNLAWLGRAGRLVLGPSINNLSSPLFRSQEPRTRRRRLWLFTRRRAGALATRRPERTGLWGGFVLRLPARAPWDCSSIRHPSSLSCFILSYFFLPSGSAESEAIELHLHLLVLFVANARSLSPPLSLIAEVTDKCVCVCVCVSCASCITSDRRLGEVIPTSPLIGRVGETGRTRSRSKHNPGSVPCAVSRALSARIT
ncbi:hypothetical protein LY76DRAFT_109291 [Colletotrichum caudatum]|nr:hypothetical protein LY76DRAFT_109291 [Colletotrichum caudatum]